MRELVVQFLESTAWPMEVPETGSGLHMLMLIAGVPAAVAAARLTATKYRKETDEAEKDAKLVRILFFCALFLACSEVYKQLFLYEIVNRGKYDWWYFPFQLCSIPMYLGLLMPLLYRYGCKRSLTVCCTFLQDFGLLGGIMALIEPSGLMHPYWILTLHGLIWHLCLVYMGCCCGFACLADRTYSGYLRTLPLFAFCCLIAEFINIGTHAFGYTDMFYISPYEENVQMIFHQIAQKTGILAGNIIYLSAVMSGAFLLHVFFRKIR